MKLASALLTLVLAGSAIAQTTTAPATKPVIPPLTAEQQAFVTKINKQAPWEPAVKMEVNAYNRVDGSPNPGFGKENVGFLRAHEGFLKRKEKPIDLLFLGDSITQGWSGGGKKVWAERYDKLKAANFGIGGDRTQHVLWRIQEGELDGIKPKVVVLMIGTNNSGMQSTAEDITKGVKAIVDQIHTKLPDSKLLLLGIFPRGADPKTKGTADIRAKLQAVNAELAKLDDGKKTRYLEIWNQFLTDTGELTKEVMPDALHPNEKGYEIWADSMQKLLDEMMQ